MLRFYQQVQIYVINSEQWSFNKIMEQLVAVDWKQLYLWAYVEACLIQTDLLYVT